MQRFVSVGLGLKDNKQLRATRCFVVNPAAEADFTKWIWAAAASPELVGLARELKVTQALRLVGIEVEEDEAPMSGAAKEVQKVLDGRKAGQNTRRKG